VTGERNQETDASGESEDILDRVDQLRDPSQYQYLSGEELRYFLAPDPDWVVADFGSGTGFYTDEIAPVAETVYAIDSRRPMHAQYQAVGMPANVAPVTADFSRTPFADGVLDGVFSTRTFHHGFEPAVEEVARVLRPGGRFVVVDWSATGAGDREPSVDEEYADLATVQSHLLDAGFTIRAAQERRETFVIVATHQE
jgi:SAM-dependent methyltransferase